MSHLSLVPDDRPELLTIPNVWSGVGVVGLEIGGKEVWLSPNEARLLMSTLEVHAGRAESMERHPSFGENL